MKLVAILNPQAGRGAALQLLPMLRVQLHAALVDVRMPGSAEEATAAASAAVRDEADVILAAGGDGTMNAVVNGMRGSRAALALLPVGSANDFAAQNGLAVPPLALCRGILRGARTRVDLIEVNGWRYATDGGLGLCADIADTARRLRSRPGGSYRRSSLGSSLYPLATVLTLAASARHAMDMSVRSAQWNGTLRSPLLMVNNQRLLGGHFPISPSACNDDGLFDVCMVNGRDGRSGLLRLVGEVLREQHLGSEDVHSWQSASLHIETERPARWLGDGELLSPADSFDVRVLPSSLRIVLPGAVDHTSPARRIS